MLGAMMPPSPMLGAHKYATLRGKSDFVDVIKLRLWTREMVLHGLGGCNVITRVLIKGGRESGSEKETGQ